MQHSSPSAFPEIHVTLLGPNIEHRQSLAEMLAGRTSGVSWLPDSCSFRNKEAARPAPRLSRLFDQIAGTRDRTYTDYVIRELDRFSTRLIIAYWGTIPLADLAAIKKSRPDVRLVLMVLCHPLSVTSLGICGQNLLMRRACRFLDAFLCPSEEMIRYLRDHVLGRDIPPAFVLPPCWPESFQAVGSLPPTKMTPNLIYSGRTDLASSTIHPGDDIRGLMRKLLDSGIELHHVHSAQTDDGHLLRRPFEPRPLPSLINFMSAFDASLIAYNTDACARDDRFCLTVPDRLITSVAAGVPIAVPKQGYFAVKSYLSAYPCVIEFDSPDDLARMLADRPRICELRSAAWLARKKYTAGQHGAALQRFLEPLV